MIAKDGTIREIRVEAVGIDIDDVDTAVCD